MSADVIKLFDREAAERFITAPDVVQAISDHDRKERETLRRLLIELRRSADNCLDLLENDRGHAVFRTRIRLIGLYAYIAQVINAEPPEPGAA